MKLDRTLMDKVYSIYSPGFLITKEMAYQFLFLRKTDTEYILDDYPTMPEDIRSRLHHINIKDVLAICKTRRETELWMANNIEETRKVIFERKSTFGDGYSIRVLKSKNTRCDVQVLKDGKVIFIKNYANSTYAVKKAKQFDDDLAFYNGDISKLEEAYLKYGY